MAELLCVLIWLAIFLIAFIFLLKLLKEKHLADVNFGIAIGLSIISFFITLFIMILSPELNGAKEKWAMEEKEKQKNLIKEAIAELEEEASNCIVEFECPCKK